MKDNYPKIIDLCECVGAAGGRAMLVGGCVRDELMGIEPKDWDVEVYGLETEKLKEILAEFAEEISAASGGADKSVRVPVNAVGEAFTVYKIGNDLDVSIPRRERKTGKGHKGFVIAGDPDMSFEEASRRRDFTINAILKDPLTGEIVDPFDGREDIERKILRHVSSETFAEDSLRVLRAAQFAARFEFDIAPETVKICKTIDVTDLPDERIWGELEKLLLKAEKPSIGLKWLYALNNFDVRNQIVQLVRYHLKPGEFHKAESRSPVGDGAFRRLARKVEPDLLYRVSKADSLGRNPDWLPSEKRFGSEAQEWFLEKVRELRIEKKAPEPILMGRHLLEIGLTPSPEFKKLLDAVYEMQLDGKVNNIDDALTQARRLAAIV
ncbi:MAG: hypothetical protein LC734_01035 [Acidobacteria bacterium]|nr:hypothetical protein [Acidobacteriota bacterium]